MKLTSELLSRYRREIALSIPGGWTLAEAVKQSLAFNEQVIWPWWYMSNQLAVALGCPGGFVNMETGELEAHTSTTGWPTAEIVRRNREYWELQ